MSQRIVKYLYQFLCSIRGVAVLTLLLLSIGMSIVQAADEAPAEKAASSTSVEAEALVKELEDPKQREALVNKIKLLTTANPEKKQDDRGAFEKAFYSFITTVMTFPEAMEKFYASLKDVPSQLGEFGKKLSSLELMSLVQFLVILSIAEGAGYFFGRLVSSFLASSRERTFLGNAVTTAGKHFFLMVNIGIRLLPATVSYLFNVLIVFTLYHFVTMSSNLTHIPSDLLVVALRISLSVYILRSLLEIADAFLSPKEEKHRYIKVENEKAKHLHRSLVNLSIFVMVFFSILDIATILGLPEPLGSSAAHLGGVVVLLSSICLVMSCRTAIEQWIKDVNDRNVHRPQGIREVMIFLADTWHVFAILFMVGLYFKWSTGSSSQNGDFLQACGLTLLIIIGVHLLIHFTSKLLHTAGKKDDAATIEGNAAVQTIEGSTAKQTTSFPKLDALLSVLYYLGGIAVILQVWGVPLSLLVADSLGHEVLTRSIKVGLFVFFVVGLWEVLDKVFGDYLKDEVVEGKVIKPSARVVTLVPIIRNIVRWAVVIVTALMVLSQLGFNVATLLAAFGVFGLAVAMGSQKLAQDIVTGVFILMENSLEVGDVISAGGVSGEVVSFNIRTLTLRNITGELHTVPYSAIGSVSNLSRDYSNCILEVGVGHDASIPLVTSLFEKIGKDMLADRKLSPKVLSPLQVIGVSKISDHSTTVIAVMKTEPDPYHLVEFEFRKRAKIKFAEVQMPMPSIKQVVSFLAKEEGEANLKIALAAPNSSKES